MVATCGCLLGVRQAKGFDLAVLDPLVRSLGGPAQRRRGRIWQTGEPTLLC
jgi:hypothetical protein